MSSNDDFLGSPIPLDAGGSADGKSKGGLSPLPSIGLGGKDELAALSAPREADESNSGKSSVEGLEKIHTFAKDSKLGKAGASTFKRALNAQSHSATRARTFHSRLTTSAMEFMDQQINEWVDSHEDIEVKFCTSTVGPVEGKRTEPNLIVTVWY